MKIILTILFLWTSSILGAQTFQVNYEYEVEISPNWDKAFDPVSSEPVPIDTPLCDLRQTELKSSSEIKRIINNDIHNQLDTLLAWLRPRPFPAEPHFTLKDQESYKEDSLLVGLITHSINYYDWEMTTFFVIKKNRIHLFSHKFGPGVNGNIKVLCVKYVNNELQIYGSLTDRESQLVTHFKVQFSLGMRKMTYS
mgnify:CR=1 FL=1